MNELLSTAIVLENKRARLEPLHKDHFDILKTIALDPSLWQFSSSKMNDEADLQQYINTAIEEKEKGISYPFIIYDVATGKAAGCTRYGNITPQHKRLEIGWTWYAVPFQRTGLNRACKFELLRFAFERLGCIRIELKTSSLNIKSQTAIEKIGATKEGVFRSHMINPDGSYRDTVYFSILQTEWPQIKQSIFKEYI
ncbi:MAG TPA: GNAT family protein [Chitinophagaceae bacterium]